MISSYPTQVHDSFSFLRSLVFTTVMSLYRGIDKKNKNNIFLYKVINEIMIVSILLIITLYAD